MTTPVFMYYEMEQVVGEMDKVKGNYFYRELNSFSNFSNLCQQFNVNILTFFHCTAATIHKFSKDDVIFSVFKRLN